MINLDHYSSLLYGNGFALNVYLPSLINLGIKKIFIDKSQIENVSKINILKKYKEYIIYFNPKEFKEQLFDFTILAVSPFNQYNLVLSNYILKNTTTLILEKPIAISPAKSIEILKKLDDLSINYLVNYSFRYAFWYKDISAKIKNLPKDVDLYFTWKFMARHFIHKRDTWKRIHSQGGGAIRFYGIHLIAILSDIGYLKVLKSICLSQSYSDISSFSCSFDSTKRLPKCNILINSNSLKNEFNCYYIKDNKKISLLQLEEPFPKRGRVLSEDPRIKITEKFLKEKKFYYNNFNIINLWKEVEDKIQFNYFE